MRLVPVHDLAAEPHVRRRIVEDVEISVGKGVEQLEPRQCAIAGVAAAIGAFERPGDIWHLVPLPGRNPIAPPDIYPKPDETAEICVYPSGIRWGRCGPNRRSNAARVLKCNERDFARRSGTNGQSGATKKRICGRR